MPGITGKTDVSYLSATALELAGRPELPDGRRGEPDCQFAGWRPGSDLLRRRTTARSFYQPRDGSHQRNTARECGHVPVINHRDRGGGTEDDQELPLVRPRPVSPGLVGAATGSVGSPARLTVRAADGLIGCTLRFAATGLPSGVSMNSCGQISGWPSASGRYQVTVQVTDSSATSLAQRTFGWKVLSGSGRGPAGHIRLSRDGKCLARLAASVIAIERCSRAAGQRWTIAANGSVRVGQQCLTATSSVLSAGSCRNGGQRWQLRSGGALTNLSNRKCLADNGSKNGSRAVAAACRARPNNTGSTSTPSANQRWMLPAGPLTAGIAGFCASDWHRRAANSVR